MMMFILSISCISQVGMPPGGAPPEGMMPKSDKKMSLDEFLTKMTVELQLDELQQLEIRAILKDEERNANFGAPEIKRGEKPNFQELKEKIEAKKKELTAKFALILTADQLKKWSEESDSWQPDE